MEFNQKRMASRMRFVFEPTELRFWIRDNSGERETIVDYAHLPGRYRRVFERNTWIRNVGALWCALGAVMIGVALAGARPLTGSGFWLLLGLGCLAFYWFTRTDYTVLDTEQGSIWVMDGEQSAAILNELQARRKSRLLDLYGTYDPENDHEREVQKFDWLVKEQVLSREDADRRIASARKDEELIAPSPRLLN